MTQMVFCAGAESSSLLIESNQTPAQAFCQKQGGDQVTPLRPSSPPLSPEVFHSLSSLNFLQALDSADANETLVLEHYRFAVFELTRQNILLKRQLAAAEARLAQEDSTIK